MTTFQPPRQFPALAVCLAATVTIVGTGTAAADTSCGTVDNSGRTGTVYVIEGSVSCSQAQATVEGALTGPTVDVSGTGRGRQYTDSSGIVWSLYWPGAAEDDQRLHIWSDSGIEYAWG